MFFLCQLGKKLRDLHNQQRNKERLGAYPDEPYAAHVNKNAGVVDPDLSDLKHKFGAFELDKDKCMDVKDFKSALEPLVGDGLLSPADVVEALAKADPRG